MQRRSDIRLGQLLVVRNWCSLSAVNEGLLTQTRLRVRNESRPLGAILVQAGVIDEETLKEALAELGVLEFHCPDCKQVYPMAAYTRGTVPLCDRCNRPLVLTDPQPGVRGEAQAPEGSRSRLSPSDPTPARPASAEPVSVPERPTEFLVSDTESQRDTYLGKVLGGCQLLEKVGHGGMGVVYKARQLNLGRTVAVKILSSDLSRDAAFVRRFIQEARSAAQLSHGNIVHINDVGECQGVFYFVMEYVDGENLREVLRSQEKLDVAQAVEITLQVCQALRHAHSRGIIHRDIKPENIMITQDRVVKLADLGLAKRVTTDDMEALTHAGSVLGTPFYMAPEQAKDFSKVDHRSDIYSLGVTLYRMLTGKVPFDGRSPIEVMIKAIDGRRAAVRDLREEVPQDLERVVDRMMHKQPEKRYQDVTELINDLSRVAAVVAV